MNKSVMGKITIKMEDVERCLICHTCINKGHDPALCWKKSCNDIFNYELAFNKFARKPVEI